MKGKHAAPSKYDIERLRKLRDRRINTNTSSNGDRRETARRANYRQNGRANAAGTGRGNKYSRKGSGKKKLLLLILVAAVGFGLWTHWFRPIDVSKFEYPNWISQQFIAKGGSSRTGAKTNRINGIVIHYTANPGSSAQNNRDYFNSPQSQVSSHFVVGLNGEVIQCVPLDEQSSASNRRNIDTISIEVCHPDSTGEFSIPSYNAAVKLCVWLCENFRLDEDDIIRHYDCEGAAHKLCPKYYVEHEDAWERFKGYVEERL